MTIRMLVLMAMCVCSTGCELLQVREGRQFMAEDGAVDAGPDSGSAADGGLSGTALSLPLQALVSQRLYSVGTLDAGVVSFVDVVTYALAEGYPRQVTIAADSIAMVATYPGCRASYLRWQSVESLSGGSARVTIDGESLSVNLVAEGDSKFRLKGEFVQQVMEQGRCTVDGAKPETIAMEQVLTVETRVPAAVKMVSPYSEYEVPGCSQKMVVPRGAQVPLPQPRLVDASGQLFWAANAGEAFQVAVVIEAPAGFSMGTPIFSGKDTYLFNEGLVTLTPQTTLPVSGTTAITVVGQQQLTTFEAEFRKHRYTKGDEWQLIQSGDAVNVDFGRKVIRHQFVKALVGSDRLCVQPPASWYHFVSSTPEVCAFGAETPNEASVLADGVCGLSVEVPGAQRRWSAQFTVSGSQVP